MRKDEKDTFGSAWEVKRTGLGGSFGKAKGRHFPCSCFTCFKSRDINNEGGKAYGFLCPPDILLWENAKWDVSGGMWSYGEP